MGRAGAQARHQVGVICLLSKRAELPLKIHRRDVAARRSRLWSAELRGLVVQRWGRSSSCGVWWRLCVIRLGGSQAGRVAEHQAEQKLTPKKSGGRRRLNANVGSSSIEEHRHVGASGAAVRNLPCKRIVRRTASLIPERSPLRRRLAAKRATWPRGGPHPCGY
jgi:hypothetical protein